MAANTYVALDKKTVSSAVTSVTFTSIPGTYTDLVIVASVTTNRSGNIQDLLQLQFNGDTGAHYSDTFISGDGSSASSGRHTGYGAGFIGNCGGGTSTSNQFSPITINIGNYANTTTYKSYINRASFSGQTVGAYTGIWKGSTGSSTEAITSITIGSYTGSTILSGSTFSLYGVKAEVGGSSTKATGGVVTSDATYYYHTFTTVGMFVPNQSISADILVVAGGGGGGYGSGGGGGGGAGGLVAYTSQSLTAVNYPVIVGAGGNGGNSSRGTNGTASQFNTLTASAGGGGGGQPSTSGVQSGLAGGSGGGGAYQSGAGGTPTSGQGYVGGTGDSGSIYEGGGGGAGGAGGNATSGANGAGGVGLNTYSSWATATSTGVSGYYAGGGGGSGGGTQAAGGSGGGGSNGDAVANTGSGGGGGRSPAVGGNGGSGIVIVRYAK